MQLSLDVDPQIPDDAYSVGGRASGGTHGVVLTKPHIVTLILDLCGYSPSGPIWTRRLLEPSCGTGVFVVEAARRLATAARAAGVPIVDLGHCITALDIDPNSVSATRMAAESALVAEGVERIVATALSSQWVRRADALLIPNEPFDYVVGNPPYIRIEQLSARLQAEYRRRFHTLYDRADLYVAFIEKGLSMLSAEGVLGFICADRWTLNKYGGPLRALIARSFGVKAYIDLHAGSPFESEVAAYPSIFIIGRGASESVPVAVLTDGGPEECTAAAEAVIAGRDSTRVDRHSEWFSDDEPWILLPPAQRELLRRLEQQFPPLEASAVVGIGVATGCDSVYVVGPDTDIEPDRLVPLVCRGNIKAGAISPGDRYVINTFDASGRPVDLERYPRLRQYFEAHRPDIQRRHVAKKNAVGWFRTIDRVYPELTTRPKLLIPDIAASLEVTYDAGRYYPHHNLYYVTSDTWDLEVLGGFLSSQIALFFLQAYSVRMRGGYLRFQAQYLRRIRVPHPDHVRPELAAALRAAFRARKSDELNALVAQAYGLDSPLGAR